MSVLIGSKELQECFIGSTPVKEIYVGSTLVWPTKAPEWVVTINELHPTVAVKSSDEAPDLVLSNGFPTYFGHSSSSSQWKLSDGSKFTLTSGSSYSAYFFKPITFTASSSSFYASAIEAELGTNLVHFNIYTNRISILYGSTVIGTLNTDQSGNKTHIQSYVGISKEGNTIGVHWICMLLEGTVYNTYEVSGGFTLSGDTSFTWTLCASQNGIASQAVADYTGVASIWNYNTYYSSSSIEETKLVLSRRLSIDTFQSGDTATITQQSVDNKAILVRTGGLMAVADTNVFKTFTTNVFNLNLSPTMNSFESPGYPVGRATAISILGTPTYYNIGVQNRDIIFLTLYSANPAWINGETNHLTGVSFCITPENKTKVYLFINNEIIYEQESSTAIASTTARATIALGISNTPSLTMAYQTPTISSSTVQNFMPQNYAAQMYQQMVPNGWVISTLIMPLCLSNQCILGNIGFTQKDLVTQVGISF